VEPRPRAPRRLSSIELESLTRVVNQAFPRSQAETRASLVAMADIQTFRAGETVIPQGDETWTVFVLDGHVGFRRTTLDGRELIPRIVTRGELSSLMPIAGRPSAVESVALSASRVVLWPSSELQALAAGDAGFGLDLLEHVLVTFDAVVDRLEGFLHQNALRRVARVLDQHGDVLFGDEAVLTRSYLPALVGTSREMTRRVLRALESDGVVKRIGRDGLRLLDPARLAQAAATRPLARVAGRNKFLANPPRPMQE
jgi:CRP-like cAMP-binding protein